MAFAPHSMFPIEIVVVGVDLGRCGALDVGEEGDAVPQNGSSSSRRCRKLSRLFACEQYLKYEGLRARAST